MSAVHKLMDDPLPGPALFQTETGQVTKCLVHFTARKQGLPIQVILKIDKSFELSSVLLIQRYNIGKINWEMKSVSFLLLMGFS